MIPRLRRDEEEQERFPDAADETVCCRSTTRPAARRGGPRRSPQPRVEPDRRRERRTPRLIIHVRRPGGPPYIPGVLETIGYEPEMAGWAASADADLGRVVRVDRGLVSVLTEDGPHRAGIGARLLARWPRTRPRGRARATGACCGSGPTTG